MILIIDTEEESRTKYCIECKKLYNNDTVKCEYCDAMLVENIEKNPMAEVLLTSCSGLDKDLIVSELKNNDVEYRIQKEKVEKYAHEASRERLTSYIIYIPVKEALRAERVLNGINRDTVYQNVDLSVQTDYDEEIKNIKNNKLLSIILMIIVLVLVSLTVFGTDYIMSLLKNLF